MIILGISRTHNSSIALLNDNEVILHVESERFTNSKYEPIVFSAINEVKKYTDKVDYIAIAGFNNVRPIDNEYLLDAYTMSVLGLGKTFKNNGVVTHDFSLRHHDMHASCAFYNSGFDDALVIIKDGAGSFFFNKKFPNDMHGREISSIYQFSYPTNLKILNKKINVPFKIDKDIEVSKNIFITNDISDGWAFELISKEFGFSSLDAGKVMGMSSYGRNKNSINFFNNSNYEFIFSENMSYYPKLILNIPESFNDRCNIARELQEQTEDRVIEEILYHIDKTGQKNLCLSGGLFLNCVMNYKIKKSLPSDINLYIEPISSDSGTSLGAAKYLYYLKTNSKEKIKQKNIYYGPKHDSHNHAYKNVKSNISASYVAELIANKKIVALYQGSSESGPRALGNRSILYDPRDPDGKERVNIVKNREWFRPFAGTVMHEFANDWFDMHTMDESPFMMYAIDVLEEKRQLIPSITHIDGTCRIQTLKYDQNPKYYQIIKNFYDLTGIPIVLNTSFNLAGDCIVDTVSQAIETFDKSDIDYLYLADSNELLFK